MQSHGLSEGESMRRADDGPPVFAIKTAYDRAWEKLDNPHLLLPIFVRLYKNVSKEVNGAHFLHIYELAQELEEKGISGVGINRDASNMRGGSVRYNAVFPQTTLDQIKELPEVCFRYPLHFPLVLTKDIGGKLLCSQPCSNTCSVYLEAVLLHCSQQSGLGCRCFVVMVDDLMDAESQVCLPKPLYTAAGTDLVIGVQNQCSIDQRWDV
ncbi:hypothetical protein BJ508DRAFT_14035 [Ascobolus immersus RN42]|uniref:Uncharacterized protein n=1 Tax=Ascobolus immersus RN42 TaxID=1160509 RepID=A0A3N4ILX9_ASCIM|nr:hypothetical protein BJ508DRAFT_14035 [Ascobolus immersus RN42]